jgi:probable HAF family extracellular repeat protein
VWQGGKFTSLFDVPGALGTVAYGINAAGSIVGEYADSSNTVHGFVLQGGSLTRLDSTGTGTVKTIATGINAAGSIIVGYDVDGSNTAHGFVLQGGIYTPDSVTDALNTYIYGINAAGTSIVGSYVASDGTQLGFGGTLPGNTITNLNAQALGALSTAVSGINAAGTIVGVYTGYIQNTCNFSRLVMCPAKFTYLDGPGRFLSL